MADNTIYDLLDELTCADYCETVTALCELIDELLKDMQHLELECSGTRYLLSQYMDEEQGSLLRSDILESLGHRQYGSPTYQLFLKSFSMTAEIPWNSSTILPRYKKPVKANGLLALIYH